MKIITDSSSDIGIALARELDITVIPLNINFAEESFASYTELSTKDFYKKMSESSELPTTSQPTPFAIEEIVTKVLETGEEVVGIFMSSKLSGTFQSSLIAKENIGSDKFHCIDSCTLSCGQNALVRYAVQLRDSGITFAELCQKIEEIKPKIVVMMELSKLRNVIMGGRLSKAQGMVGGILGIRPILQVDCGEVKAVAKERGATNAINYLCKAINTSEIDYDKPIVITHANSPSEMELLISSVKASCPNFNFSTVYYSEFGPTVGVHSGEGASGISFFRK